MIKRGFRLCLNGVRGMLKDEEAGKVILQEHFALAAKSAKIMLWQYNVKTHQAITMQAGLSAFGIPNKMENLPEALFPYLENNSIEKVKAFYTALDNGVTSADCEMWIKQTKGREAICIQSFAAKLTEDGVYYCWSKDISLEKMAQQQYENVMNGIVQDSTRFISVVVINLSANTVKTIYSKNNYVKELQDASYDELVVKFSKSFVEPADGEEYVKHCNRDALIEAFTQGTNQGEFTFRCRLSTGGVHWVKIRYNMTKDPLTGDVMGVSYARDVNREILKDQVLKRLTDWDFECIAVIDLLNNDEYIFLSRNEEALKVLPNRNIGYESEIKYMADHVVVPEQREDYLNAVLLPGLLKHLEKEDKFSYSVSLRDEKGNFYNKLLHFNYMDEDRQIILFTAMDMTESYLQHQEELKTVKAAVEHEEEAWKYRNLFFSNISHDMRTPLNGILGFTDLALQETDAEKMRQYLSKIKLSGGLLLDLINDTLMLSKLESGKLQPNYEIIDNRLISGRILVPIKAMADAKNITLVQDRSRSPHVMMKADRVNTQKIFLNLIGNAVKFTPKGGTVTIVMEQLSEPLYNCNYRFIVKDTGVGISPNFLPHIYEPFVQDSTRNALTQPQLQGTGLGLAIVKQLVDLLHGHIDVESTLGKGTTFTVYLPMPVVGPVQGEPEWVPGAAPITAPAPITKAKDLQNYKILLCEDNSLNMEIATILLKKKNYEVIQAVNGQEGVKKFQASGQGEISAILMDLRMPILDGFDAARTIRELKRPDAQSVPIIALSADAYEEDVQKVLQVGMNAHLAKPFKPQEIYSLLQKLITH